MVGGHDRRFVTITLLAAAIFAVAPSAAFATITSFRSSTIASGAQYDLYTFFLVKGAVVEARLVCNFNGVSRPLDPVLSVYFPGSDPSDTINADVYNDDGFGLDDHPEGVDCDAFDSSRLTMTAPVTGNYTFRADGFGSSTGPYTMTVFATPTTVDLDFDLDHTADIGVFRRASGAFLILRSSDASISQVCCASPTDLPVPSDYDGDLKADIAVYRPSNGAFFILQSSNGAIVQRAGGGALPGDRPAPGDYDGDSKVDAAIVRGGAFYVFQTSTGTVVPHLYPGASPGDVPVPADYDGDGKTDVAVYRPNGSFVILRSSDGVITQPCCASPSDVPIPADYDGDFKTDVAVYRPSTGQFFIIRSSTGAIAADSLGPPRPGDRPISSDYDFDGNADVAIYRASTGTFIYKRTRDGVIVTLSGASPALGDIPLQ
jgi:hypothetical protein